MFYFLDAINPINCSHPADASTHLLQACSAAPVKVFSVAENKLQRVCLAVLVLVRQNIQAQQSSRTRHFDLEAVENPSFSKLYCGFSNNFSVSYFNVEVLQKICFTLLQKKNSPQGASLVV